MKVFKHKNGILYYIAWFGRGRTISPPNRQWNWFWAFPYHGKGKAFIVGTEPKIIKESDLSEFTLKFEI